MGRRGRRAVRAEVGLRLGRRREVVHEESSEGAAQREVMQTQQAQKQGSRLEFQIRKCFLFDGQIYTPGNII